MGKEQAQALLKNWEQLVVFRVDGQPWWSNSASYSSNAIINKSSLIRGSLNSGKSMVIPSQAAAMPWACVETIQEPAYIN